MSVAATATKAFCVGGLTPVLLGAADESCRAR
jgi:hypothetical protein